MKSDGQAADECATAVEEPAEAPRRADDAALLDALPDLGVDVGPVLDDLRYPAADHLARTYQEDR